MGFGLVLYANATVQAAVRAALDVVAALRRCGSLLVVIGELADFKERQRVVSKDTC